MSRLLTLSALALLIAVPAFSQGQCNLGMAMTCTNGQCTAVTTNNGSNMCTGEYFVAIIIDDAQGRGIVTNFHQNLGLTQCFDQSVAPSAHLGFGLCLGSASLAPGNSYTMSGQVTLNGADPSTIVAATEVTGASGADIGFAYVFNNSTVVVTCTPNAQVSSGAQSDVPYNVTWPGGVTDTTSSFTVEESSSSDFSTILASRNVTGFVSQFHHPVTSPTTYYYRVRANTCGGPSPGPNSPTVSIVVSPAPTIPAASRSGDVSTPLDSTTPVTAQFFIANPLGKTALDTVPFTAATDKPFMTVTPSSGTIPPGGTTVTVTLNPTNLPPGANTGTLTVTSNGATVATKSVSVSLVTPVAPGSTGLPPANALIIPAVAHAPGANGPFQSDVRLANAGSTSVSYQIKYTPTGSDPNRPIKTTTISVDAGQTIALNDILRDFFGVGATADPADRSQGALEIRPLNNASATNYAASRTFTFNANGTFGQFIAAIPFSQFATKQVIAPIPGVTPPTTNPVMSLQQVAQSTKFRTNLGLVEGAGSPASGTIRVLDNRGTLVTSVPFTLQAGEHRQGGLNGPPYNIPNNLDDGRIEVIVESATGAVTAYASVLDNITSDPLEVTPVQVSQISSTRYILPGMAALSGTPGGANNFHSDIRIYNGGSAQAAVTATFYPQGANSTPKVYGPFTIENGGVRAFDDVVANQFASSGQGGSIVLTTTAPTSMVATGRTYTIDDRASAAAQGGTFGQFIPGVVPAQGIGAGDRALQILQLEQSASFRSNLGLTELSGNPAHVRLTVYIPDSKTSVSTELDLAPNEFRQLGRVLDSFYPGQSTYNARISVEVTSGTGRVAAYGSVIDNFSSDATYVPSQ
jgi:hypothetical protein